jgi:hypothetical protein
MKPFSYMVECRWRGVGPRRWSTEMEVLIGMKRFRVVVEEKDPVGDGSSVVKVWEGETVSSVAALLIAAQAEKEADAEAARIAVAKVAGVEGVKGV